MRLMTLNGAPLCEHLNFNEAGLLTADERHAAIWPAVEPETSATNTVKWWCVPAKDTRLHSGWSQHGQSRSYLLENDSNSPFSIPGQGCSVPSFQYNTTNFDTTIMSLEEHAPDDDDFLKHSIHLNDTLLSSQIAKDMEEDRSVSSSSFLTTSFLSTIFGPDDYSNVENHGNTSVRLPSTMTISTLSSLPNAHLLRSMYPQTPTPTLVCVVAAPLEHRQVLVRKGGYKMNLYEATVADDTSAGFRITFWVRPGGRQTREQSVLVETLDQAKVGDILLLRNIALSIFRDRVYGQSLNPSISRARTTVHVLARSDGETISHPGSLPASVSEALSRVKRWARTRIAPKETKRRKRSAALMTHSSPSKRKLRSSKELEEDLPPDTLEAF